jgi:hypothetical protein
LCFQDHFTKKLQHFEVRTKECYKQQRFSISSNELPKIYKEVETKWAKKLEKKEKHAIHKKKDTKQKKFTSFEQSGKESGNISSLQGNDDKDEFSSDEDDQTLSSSSSQETTSTVTNQ